MMSATALRKAWPRCGLSGMVGAWLALGLPTSAFAALPSGSADSPTEDSRHGSSDASSEAPAPWVLPPLRLGGSVSYSQRRDQVDGVNSMQSGLLTTLNARTSGYLWQPWFAQLDGNLGLTQLHNTSEGDLPSDHRDSTGLLLTGRGQLSVLAQSRFPLQAYVETSDNRVDGNVALSGDYVSKRYGLTQSYFRDGGEASLSYDRSTQSSADFGGDQQDSLQLRSSHTLQAHRLQFGANRSTNRHENTGESTRQDNLLAQHHYQPDSAMSVLSLVNLSSADLEVQQGVSSTRLAQVSSNALWRGADQPWTLSGGLRALTLVAEQAGQAINPDPNATTRMLQLNANAGALYELNRSTRFQASANLLALQNGKLSQTTSSEILGASYQPDPIAWGAANYHWSLAANAFHRSGDEDAQAGLSLQWSHGLGHSRPLQGGSTLRLGATQALTVSSTQGNPAYATGVAQPAQRQLTHSATAAWDLLQETGAALLRLSFSDARALDVDQAFFQLLHVQASSNLPTSGYSAWNGNLTLQVVRQGRQATDPGAAADASTSRSASGSLSYQTQRLWGVRNLRWGSDLRLNLQAQQAQLPFFQQQAQQSFLSQLESRANQETAAWFSYLDYALGRVQLRLQATVSRMNVARTQPGSLGTLAGPATEERTQRSVYLTLTRRFGQI